jgi:hypothetical protein
VVLAVLVVLVVLVVEEAGLLVAGDLRLNDCVTSGVEILLIIRACETEKICG